MEVWAEGAELVVVANSKEGLVVSAELSPTELDFRVCTSIFRRRNKVNVTIAKQVATNIVVGKFGLFVVAVK